MRVFLAFLAGALIVTLAVALAAHYAGQVRGPQYIRVDALPSSGLQPRPQCESPLAVLEGMETLVLQRNGTTATLLVMHDGAVRGTLMQIDLATRTLRVAARPPAGWSIGGQ